MDELDLDSFIANMEQTAPEDNSETKLACKECGGRLEEEEDGNLACPNCSAQATNILQYDETELHHDEQGRPVYGQRVALAERRSKHQVDYGWAWSTDEAIVLILSLQLDALERANLIPELFRPAVTNMWLKFWLEAIAPHIKDEYGENDLLPISAKNVLKLRDIEVLFKVRDKIMIPLRSIWGTQDVRRIYSMMNTQLTKSIKQDDPSTGAEKHLEDHDYDDDEDCSSGSSVSFDVGPMDKVPDQLVREFDRLNANDPVQEVKAELQEVDESPPDEVSKENILEDIAVQDLKRLASIFYDQTQNLSKDSVKILTLNRTLAFIEATARCLPERDPLFAADIIRACNQDLIPFYNSSKFLPDYMRLTSRDRLLFQKTTPPTPIQLTRTASLLIGNIYKNQLPKTLPVPDLDTILERFAKDMNLPGGVLGIVVDRVRFENFIETRPMKFETEASRRLPQYDRWAFAVLLSYLKYHFNLGKTYLETQKLSALAAADQNGEEFFVMSDWIWQISTKVDLILRSDPCAIYHPLCNQAEFEVSSQLADYIRQRIESKPVTHITNVPGDLCDDSSLRNELVEVLKRELRPPASIRAALSKEGKYDVTSNVKYPITDAFERICKACPELVANQGALLFKDFHSQTVVTLTNLPRWSIYDNGVHLNKANLLVSPKWPQAYRKLIQVGAFICFCEPEELVNEIRKVEEHLEPQNAHFRRRSYLSQKDGCPSALNR